MSGPCDLLIQVSHLIIGVFTGVGTLLGIYLAHRRRLADAERRAFYSAMLDKHDAWSNYDAYRRVLKKRGNGQ